jgi:GT2 family glycosyltransferase
VDLSAVIVNWNSGSFLGRLLDSLEPLARELAAVQVMDNASEDSSFSIVQDRPWVCLHRFEQNRGFAAAANAGIRGAESEAILLLNPDIEVTADAVRGLLEELSSRPRTAIVCGALVGPDREPQARFQIRRLPTLGSVLSDTLFIDELLESMGRRHRSEPTGGTVEQPAAAYWLLRKRAWQEIGGFDERFIPAWFEDVDFCRRLASKGWSIEYFPQWPAVHRGGIALDVLGYRKFVRIYYRNLLRYWRKHHPATLPLIWLPVKLGVGMRILLGRR